MPPHYGLVQQASQLMAWPMAERCTLTRARTCRQTQAGALHFHSNGAPKTFFHTILVPSFEKAMGASDGRDVVCPDPPSGRWCPSGGGNFSWVPECSATE